MSIIIDILAVFGAIMIGVGVFLQFGIGYALITGGAIMIVFALISAFVNRGSNAIHVE